MRRGLITKQAPPWALGAIEAGCVNAPARYPSWSPTPARIIAARGRNIAAARKLLTPVYYGLRDGHIGALANGAA